MHCPAYAEGIQDMCNLLTALVLTILKLQRCLRELPSCFAQLQFRA